MESHRGAGPCLVLGARRQDAVGHGNAGLELHVEDAARAFIRHNFEVVGLAPDDRAEGDERIEAPAEA